MSVFFSGAVGLLFISSGISMSIPFCIGKVIDVIYSDRENMTSTLTNICQLLGCVFVIGALANMGRIYIMNNSGKFIFKIHSRTCICSCISKKIHQPFSKVWFLKTGRIMK